MIAAGGVEVGVGRRGGFVRRVPDEPGETEQQQRRSPRRPTRAGIATPRRAARTATTARCEYSTCLNANSPSQTDAPSAADDGRDPAGGKARVEERGPAIERRPRAPQHDSSSVSSDRLPRSRRPSAATPRCRPTIAIDRQVVRGVEPPRQALRQQQQRRADDAAEEMRRLDHAERQDRSSSCSRPAAAGVAPEKSRSTPPQKRDDRQHARRQLLGQTAEQRRLARAACAATLPRPRRRPAPTSATASGSR